MAVYKYGQAAKTTLPTATATADKTAAPKQDNGGFLGGIGYVAEKAGLGFLSTFEGVWDYAAGGIASMFGNNEWAEQQFKNDWVDYSHPDTWYQPSEGWKVAGDVASGIGNSAANLVPYGIAAAVTYFSGGTLAPVAAAIVKGGAIGSSIALAGVGAAGQSTKQAYQETGKLGQAEYGYGALSGATEGLLEGATNLIGFGSGAVAKSLSRAAAKEAAETVAKETIGKTLIKGFSGEAFEEGMSAFLEPQYAKITYDPNAQNATAQEIAYSAFVGGLAGMVMGGTASVAEKVATRRQDAKTGEELVAQGKEASILEMAREVAETERNTPTGDHAFEYTKEAYDKLMQSLATTDGKVTNDSQKRMLGEVARWSSFSAFSPMISKSAANIYQNAEAFAERLNAYYSSVGGNMSVTAEDIRNGLDPKDPKTFKTALETNPTLRMLAIADATGHLFLDSTRFAQAAAEGRGIATQDDINRLLETADEAKINALSQRYGVDLRTATASEFNKAVTQYMQSGGYDTEMGEVRRSKAAKGADEKTAKTKLPKAISLKDGETVRYKVGDEDFSITREGDGYYLHDNKTDRATRKLTKAEVNKRLADYRQQSELSKPDTGDNAQKKTAETIDAWAGENVIGYNKLGNADKVGIRRLINSARSHGVSDADIAIYASISARSGVKITFESKPDADYNGYYSHKDNLITINIAKTKSAESTIIHEFDHAIRAVDGDFYIPVKEAADALTDAEFMQVMEAYSNETAMGKADELTAHGAEKLLAGQGVLTRLMDEQPKLLDRVLAFFKGAESDYKALPRLSKEAKRYYKKYKKMFDALSYRNSGVRVEAPDASEIRYSLSKSKIEKLKGDLEELGRLGIVLDAGGKRIQVFTDKYTADKNIFSKKGRSDREVNARIKAIQYFAEILKSSVFVGSNTEISGVEKDAKKGVVAMLRFKGEYGGFDVEAVIRDKGAKQFLYEMKFIEKEKSPQQSTTDKSARPAPKGDVEDDVIVAQPEQKVNPLDENSVRKSKVLPSNSLDESISPENLERTRELKTELFRKMQEAKKKADAVVDKEWDNTFMSRLAELISNDADKAEIDALWEENTRRAEESGYASAKAEYDALNNQYQEAQRVINRIETELSKQLRERVYTEEEASKYASKAARKYRTTSRLRNAAYLTVNGSMLDFSEGQGYRVKDHRQISEVLDLPDYAQYSDGMIVFMNMGNIRLQTYGIDISKMPNAKQISVLRDIIPSVMREYDEFTVDFSTPSGNTDGSVTYPRGISTARIIADIKSYFDTGVVPDEPSSVGSFRYSKVLTDSQGNHLTQEQADYFKDSLVRDKNGNLLVLYHGTPKENGEFYVFDYGKSKRKGGFGFASSGKGFYFTTKRDAAEFYTRSGGRILTVYVDIKNPYIVSGDIKEQIAKDFGMDPLDVYLQDVQRILSSKGYDGVIHGKEDALTVVAYSPEQIKLVDNTSPTSDPDIRKSKVLPSDTEYLAAVKRGDMGTAQRMVREAATAARYDSPMLYHGTDSFGFTEPRTTGVEKGYEWSPFFATNRKQTAGTYTNNANVREISEQMTEEHYEKVMDDVNEEINDEIDNFRWLIDRTFSPWYFGQTDNSGLRDDFDNANAEQGYGDGIYDVFEGYIADAYYQYQDSLSDAYEDYSEWLDESEEAQKLINSVLALEGLRRKLETLYSAGEGDLGGIYQLYSNTENLFVLEGNGANWNDLRSDKLPPLSRYGKDNVPYKTRDVAEWARANGYDGVLFKDIRDSGQYGDAGISDVYVFFNPQAQVKSADPVTYDDEGNIIPLSERFNHEKSDIRYSRPVESATIGAVMTSVDEGYKAGKMETLRDTAIATQIAITNAQAGIEAYGKRHGIKDIEARVQAVRSAHGQAGEMIGGHQYRIGGATNEEKRVYLGQGLQEIMRPINDYGKGQKVSKNELKEIREAYKREFFDYLFNHLNVDRMTLESRSMDEQKARLEAQKAADADVKSLTRRYKQIRAKIGKLGRTKTDLAEKKTLRAEAKDLAAQIRKLQKEMKERQNEIEAFEPRQNKPVLRKDNGSGGFTEVSADESREQIEKYDKERPEFKEIAEKLWAFLRNLNQYRVDTGLLSQDTADLLADLYAHYVPSYRADAKVGIAAIDGKRILGVRQTVKGAKGSLKDLLPIDVMIARQVEETVRAGRINQLANILYETAIDGETDEIQIISKDKVTTEEMAEFDPTSMRPKDGQITFYRDGEKIVMRVSKEIFAGFDAFTPQIDSKNPLANTLTAINNTFKKLVTSMNPAFLARNTIRDIQDAGINTKYPKTFVQNYARAAQEIMKDGELWRLYRAFGGYSSSIFDFDSGMQGHQNRFGFTQVEGNLLQRGITAIENANAFTEQLPRFAEFISAIEAGKSVEQAILDAADVTTNFGRSGRVTQVLNRTLVPFLNPSIQGFSKMIRNVTSIRTAREFGSFALKVTLIGLLPQAINMLMYGGDDDYEELKDTDKENNFLFKVGDKFVKLPRGRVAAALGGLVNRTASAVKGEDADWVGYVENVFQQVTPVDSMSRDIFSPIRDVQFNTTWYGSPIEGRQFDNTAPKDRYDESTSSIAKAISDGLHAIGLGFGISPKKVHYLLDQYSGVIGDFVLPATTAKPERDFLSGNFTIDPVASNELSTKFYKLYDEAVYARTDGDDTATYQVRYLTKVKNAISDMYDRKREIERSNLSDKEKQAETRVIQILINEAYRTALADYSLYTDAVKATSSIEDANIRFAEATRLVYGAERALKDYDGEVYKRASALKAAGVDYDTYYSYYFSTKDIEADKDIRGNDISGSKRKKVVSTITAMKIPKEQKMILINAAGYAVKDGDIRGVKASTAKGILWRYIRNAKGLTEEQMEILARVCGFSVKNGKIVMNG